MVHRLKNKNYIFSSANSINIGRLIPQIVYYFYGYLELLRRDRIQIGESINIVVPTGNFGNILAAYYAKKMGLPIHKLICASNENKVLTDFINTGLYDRRRELILTSSPSMDILISSNLERLLYHLKDGDDLYIRDKMDKLSVNGYYEIDNLEMLDFYGGYSSENEVRDSINKQFIDNKYLMDTHTGVAYSVYKKYRSTVNDDSKTIISSTASPFKFGQAVLSSISPDAHEGDDFSILEDLSKISGLDIPEPIRNLKNQDILHNNICDKDSMKDILIKLLKVGEE